MNNRPDNKHTFAFHHPNLHQQIKNSSPVHANNEEPIHVSLGKELTNRAISILRLKEGEHIELFDEHVACTATVLNVRNGIVGVIPNTVTPIRQILPKINLIIGLLKKRQCFEEVLESCGVYGATSIQPIITNKTTSVDWYKADKTTQRYETIMLSAMEQAKQFQKPELKRAITFDEWKNNFRAQESLNIFCDWHTDSHSITNVINTPTKEIHLIVGPEGDFTSQEKSQILEMGFKRTLLSTVSVLRSIEATRLALGFLRCIK